jgi:hypothetical protein
MKKALLLLALAVASVTVAQGAAVVATNYDEASLRQRPISTAAGAGQLTGGVVALGTWAASNAEVAALFAQLPNPTVWGQIVSSFLDFGATTTIGAGFPGLYESLASEVISEGNPLIGKNIYTLIGNGATLATSTEAALVLDPAVFAVDGAVPFSARAEISNPSATIVFGSPTGPNIDTLLGTAASLQMRATVPEPLSATLLLAGLALGFRRRR